jgi:modification target Cys-rich repeat protein
LPTFWLVLNQANCLVPCKAGAQGTCTHQCIIHWRHIITQLWMNLNWVDI